MNRNLADAAQRCTLPENQNGGAMARASARLNGRAGHQRLALYASAALAIQGAVLFAVIIRYYFFWNDSGALVGVDFTVFWSAAKVAIDHGAPAVFSPQWMNPLEATLRPLATVAPFPYPPTFLAVVLPLGLLSFRAAFAFYVVLCLSAYVMAIWRLARGLDVAAMLALASFPGVVVCIYTGQNSLITIAAAGGALALLASNPIMAGACVAVLAIKPQLGVLFPLALICGRHWKAFIASGLCAAAFVAASAALLGSAAWTAFASYLPEFNRLAVLHGGHLWGATPTVFASARLLGLSVGGAYAVHALIAVPAVAAMAYLWIVRARFELKASALCIATLLVQPYLLYYDLAWLVLPIVLLMRDAKMRKLNRAEWLILGMAWLMPVQGIFAVLMNIPLQLAPVVLVALLAVVMHRHIAYASGTARPV
jgi:hypothetical protein